MKIRVKVSPRASREKVEYLEDQKVLKIWTTAPPVEGKANDRVIELVSDYLKIPKSEIKIVTGVSSKQKLIEIDREVTEDELTKRPKLF